ncbi:MBL fold metallo-hydrolase [Marinactinospora rubrisoli]|uniref:MBL fold metallo-hydrolase n=1 Tax=Marinactinospora rubrisoli TaxID=2715399 RepID=A0ABW2KD69_9ACTN
MRQDGITEVATGIHLVHGSNTNWVIITEGDTVTLVDTGYPGDREQVLASLASVGRRPEDVAAVLITHAHTDHIGAASLLGGEYGVPVYMHEKEAPHARWEFRTQVTLGEVLRNAWRPGVLPWVRHAVRSGGLTDARVPMARPFPVEGALDLPGHPVPVHTPGHTAGHSCYHLPHAGVLITGDTLVSGHPTSRLRGPQLLPRMFDHDRAGALASLDVLERIEADVLLPGHGPVHRGPAREAAALARERAS